MESITWIMTINGVRYGSTLTVDRKDIEKIYPELVDKVAKQMKETIDELRNRGVSIVRQGMAPSDYSIEDIAVPESVAGD